MNLRRILPTGCVAAALALSLAGAGGATNAEKSKSTVSIVRAVVSGPLAGGDGKFSMLLEGFAFKSSDGRGVAVAADAFFGSVECTTLEFDVVWRGPGRATKERSQEQGCARKATSRDSAADGSFTWSAPDLRLSGSATSIVATEIFELRDRCRSS